MARFQLWLLGIFVVLLGWESREANSGGWAVVWAIAAALWLLVGALAAVGALARRFLSVAGEKPFTRPTAPRVQERENPSGGPITGS